MDDQNNQTQSPPQEHVPPATDDQSSPPPAQPETPISKIKLIAFGVLLLVSGFFFFFFYQSNFATPQTAPTGTPTQQPTMTIPPTEKVMIITPTPKVVQTTSYNSDTVSVKVPSDWRIQSNTSAVMSFTSSDTGAIFTITSAANNPVMTSREIMDKIQNVSPDDEPYYDHQPIGNTYGLFYESGKTQKYVVSNDKHYWVLTFICTEDCSPYVDQKNIILQSLVFK